MDTKLLVLKLFLDALDVEAVIDTVDDRKRVQKAVYLGQLSGIDLGYRYGWYRMGPYCPALTRDYYALANELAVGAIDPSTHALNEQVTAKLKTIVPILTPPGNLPQENWLELLASVHFLKTVSKLSDEEARATLREQKPHIADHAAAAFDILRNHKILN